MFKWLLLFIYFSSFTSVIVGERIARKKIYQSIDSKFFCIRRLTATQQFGCQSDYSGSIGALHLINSNSFVSSADQDDVSFVISRGPTPPYMPVINVNILSTKLMESFRDSGRVSGVIVVKRNSTNLSVFSTDKSCPNDGYGLYTNQSYGHCEKQKWNNPDNPVSDLFFRDFGFPVLMIDKQEDIVNIEECVTKYGVTKENPKRSWPLCSAELYIRMNAAKDSKTCMLRNHLSFQFDSSVAYCDALGSFNIFNPLIPIKATQTVQKKSLIVLASRLDALSFFFDKTPGADSPVTSLVVILSIAEALGKIRPKIESSRKADRNLLISLFNGEAFDYIGSGRTVYDLKNEAFQPLSIPDKFKKINFTKLTLEHFASFIELSQLAPYSSSDLYIHTDPISTKDPATSKQVDDLIAALQKAKATPLAQSPQDLPLPPASLQSFLRENTHIPGVLIANHNGTFENKYYNSFADDGVNIKFTADSTADSQIVKHLAAISTQISQSIYTMLTDEDDPTIKSDPQTITDLLNCFLVDASCDLFQKHGYNITSSSQFAGLTVLPFYISVRQQLTSSFVLASIIAQILATFTGTFHDVDQANCNKLKDANPSSIYYFLPRLNPNGSCVESQVFATEAVSPVFINDLPDWSLPYSTWTESFWDQPSVRIFVRPGPSQEWFTLAGGILITLFSFLIVRFMRNQSKRLFKLPSDNVVSLMRETGADC